MKKAICIIGNFFKILATIVGGLIGLFGIIWLLNRVIGQYCLWVHGMLGTKPFTNIALDFGMVTLPIVLIVSGFAAYGLCSDCDVKKAVPVKRKSTKRKSK